MIKTILKLTGLSAVLILGVMFIANATLETRWPHVQIKAALGCVCLCLYACAMFVRSENPPPKNAERRPRARMPFEKV